jgi:hypothetical protein
MTRRRHHRLGCASSVRYVSPHALAGFRGLGVSASDAAKGVGISVASKVGGSAGGAAIGTAVGVTGGIALGALTAGVGLVIAFALGKLLTKNYLNVPAMNGAEDQDVAAYNQYLTIIGQAPGRAFGLAPMLAVFRGANHSGLFPANNGVQCFHEGCSKYPGRADWVNGIVNDYGVHGNINFPDAWYRFSQDRNAGDFGPLAYNPHPSPGAAAQSYAAANTPPAAPPGSGVYGAMQAAPSVVASSPTMQVMPIVQVATPLTPTAPNVAPAPIAATARRAAPLARGALRGLGQASSGADAVNFIDNFFLPYNQQHNTWVAPKTATEHQILYDVADAYLAAKGITTVPFVANPQADVPPVTTPPPPVPVPPGTASTMMPNYSPTPLPPGVLQPIYSPVPPPMPPPPAVPPPQSSIPYYGTTMPVVDQSGGLVNPTLPPGSVPAMTAGLSNLPPWLMAAAGGILLVGFALARPAGKVRMPRRPR